METELRFSGLFLFLLLLGNNNGNICEVFGQDFGFAFPPEDSSSSSSTEASRQPLVPALFIFGDSLIDNGNNNNLASFAKANYLPYGIDFDGGPTGRFSNGYTMVDEIGIFFFFFFFWFL